MGDADLLKEIGLTRPQLDDLLSKLDNFVNTLSKEQQTALRLVQRGARHDIEEAVELLDPKIEAGQLETFIKTRTQSGVVLILKKTARGAKP